MWSKAVKALYYPYIHFQSVDWLKCALLYWEGVKRIIPFEGFLTQDPGEIHELIGEGLIEDVPATQFRARAAELFIPRLETLAQSRGNQLGGTARQFAERARDRDAHVHIEKLDERLATTLRASGLAYQAGEWFEMGEELAGLYMMTLAGEASRYLNAPMVTDSVECEISSVYFNTNDGTLDRSSDGSASARILCPFPKPEALHNVSLSRIMKIRKKYKNERRQFRKEMQSMAGEFRDIESAEALNDLVHDRRSEIEGALKAQKEMIEETNVNTVWSLMSLSVPTLITVAGAAVGIPPITIGIWGATALSVGIINWYGQQRGRRRSARQACPWHYLISLEHEFGINSALSSFEQGMKQLIFD